MTNEAVPNRVNVLRGVGITAQQARKTHCNKGHPFDEQNTHVTPEGKRRCKTCHLAWGRRYRAKQEAL